MLRLVYIGLASIMTFTPMGIVYATDRGQGAATATSGARSHYSGYHSHYYHYGGGRGGWLGDSYGWGHHSDYDRSGGSSTYRSGGPGGGGK